MPAQNNTSNRPLRLADLHTGHLPDDQAVEIAADLWWVGARWQDGQAMSHTYLWVNGDASVLFFPGSMRTIRSTLNKIAQIAEITSIQWIVCPSATPDIAGALPLLDALISRSDARVISHRVAAQQLRHLELRMALETVEDLAWQLQCGDATLQFISTTVMTERFMCVIPSNATLLCDRISGPTDENLPFKAENPGDLRCVAAFLQKAQADRDAVALLTTQLRDVAISRIAPQRGRLLTAAALTEFWRQLQTTDERYERATRDNLTGLHNRRYMDEIVTRWTRFQDRDAEQLVSVILLDVAQDGGEPDANPDQSVHGQRLRHVAQITAQQCRDEDLAVRFDETTLAIVVLGDNPDAAPSLAARIIAMARRADSASAGTKLWAGTTCRQRGETMSTVLLRAEAALRTATVAGPGRVETQ